MQAMPCQQLLSHLAPFLKKNGTVITASPAIDAVIEQLVPRSKTLIELADQIRYFYHNPENYAEKAADTILKANALPVLKHVLWALHELTDWSPDTLSALIKTCVKNLDVNMQLVAQPLRVALTGDTNSPSINVTMYHIGQDACCQRIEKAMRYIQQK